MESTDAVGGSLSEIINLMAILISDYNGQNSLQS